MNAVATGRHRHGTPGLIPVRTLVRVRRGIFGWFRPGRHRTTTPTVRTRRPVPAAA
ncbi:hypothetical protein [Nakamurella deserti]|uniref:hypothetical protein n=1 Tax=Nakamurella deserti TaxID=2164074 RepID=UPI0013003CC9|nr:hypothetical protein [Nakamurella deserti]